MAKYEMVVDVKRGEKTCFLKRIMELDFVPDTDWIFCFGDAELEVKHFVYFVDEKRKVIQFKTVYCENDWRYDYILDELQKNGWRKE